MVFVIAHSVQRTEAGFLFEALYRRQRVDKGMRLTHECLIQRAL